MPVLSIAVFYGIGQAFNGSNGLQPNSWGHIAAHAMAGGVLAELQGGKFGHGFVSAGLTKFATARGYISGGVYSGSIKAAILGGTVSSLTGGKFANGAIMSAFSYAMNKCLSEGCAQKGQNYAITDAERQLVADGKIQEFWESRLAAGDPVARAGLASLNPPGGVVDYLFGGTSINNRLQAFANVYNDGVLNIDQVRVDLANAHIRFTDLDTSGITGLLNPGQIAEYHHQVFENHGLPPTAFGGTPFTGAVGEAWVTQLVWCGGCD